MSVLIVVKGQRAVVRLVSASRVNNGKPTIAGAGATVSRWHAHSSDMRERE